MSDRKGPAQTSGDTTRERILRAAEALFAERGYARASTRAIAERAQVNEVTLFRLFGAKLGLLRAVAEGAGAGGLRALDDGALTGDYRADLVRLGHDEVANMLRRQSAVRLLVCEAAQDPELHAIVVDGSRRNQERLAAYFRGQIAAGAVRPGLDPELLAHAFFSLTSSFVMQRILLGDAAPELPVEALVAQLVEIFVRGTERGNPL
ncbi:MAG TPA: TetR/AcrR family transcriptional regulator [Chloroflexaceae bacterium]|nr:TetR/AcrR family transcriptional regulator [Chloroflexaceae bacterium]